MSATEQTDSGQAIYPDGSIKAIAEDVPAGEDHQNSGGKLRVERLPGFWLGQATLIIEKVWTSLIQESTAF